MNIAKSLSLLTCGVALAATVGAAPAAAQSVIVRNAPAGSTIEVQVNAEAARSATPDRSGDTTFAVGVPSRTGEADVRFVVDVCAMLVRLQLVSVGVPPAPAAAGCTRNAIGDVFVMRQVTTFVVDIEGTAASIHVRQGPAPPSWLSGGPSAARSRRYFQTAPPTGLVLFGGAGLPTFSNAVNVACGNVTACKGSGIFAGAVEAGAAIWIRRFLGAQVTLEKPAQTTASGNGDTFRFSSALDSRLVTVTGIVGIPAGPVRLHGLAGGNYHQTTLITTETINDATVVINNVTQTIRGGTQTFEHKTEGWNWVFGGGLEAWVARPVAFYVQFQRAKLKANYIGAVEGGIDDHLMLIVAGARVRLF